MNSWIEEEHVVSFLDRYVVNKNKIKYRISYEFISLLILFYFGLDTYCIHIYIYILREARAERTWGAESECITIAIS